MVGGSIVRFNVVHDSSQREVIIHNTWCLETPKELARMVVAASSQLQVPRLYWCNGVLFVKTIPPHLLTTEMGAKEYLTGKIHYNIAYAFMEEFQPIVRLDGREIHVLDSSKLDEDQAISKWLLEHKK